MSEMYRVNEYFNFDLDSVVQIHVLHEISFDEIVHDILVYENEEISKRDPSYVKLTDDDIKKVIDDVIEYYNKITDNGSKVDEVRDMCFKKLFDDYHAREGNS
jgi:hypothetical protein